MAGKAAGETADEDLLGPQVERGHQVDGPLVGGLDAAAEVLPEVPPGLPDGGLADPENSWTGVHEAFILSTPRRGGNLGGRPRASLIRNLVDFRSIID